jgi:hypothetical protein
VTKTFGFDQFSVTDKPSIQGGNEKNRCRFRAVSKKNVPVRHDKFEELVSLE